MNTANVKDTTRELPNLPKKHGGWRDGAGRKKVNYETKAIRVDTRLLGILAALRNKLKSGAMNDEDLKRFEELAAN
ncbi:MAG: hypothetical protein WCL34_14535 [Methylococcaceae bacterium]